MAPGKQGEEEEGAPHAMLADSISASFPELVEANPIAILRTYSGA